MRDDDRCRCDHYMIDHRENGCEDCLCEQFLWPTWEKKA